MVLESGINKRLIGLVHMNIKMPSRTRNDLRSTGTIYVALERFPGASCSKLGYR